jgi:hypothetical protein
MFLTLVQNFFLLQRLKIYFVRVTAEAKGVSLHEPFLYVWLRLRRWRKVWRQKHLCGYCTHRTDFKETQKHERRN